MSKYSMVFEQDILDAVRAGAKDAPRKMRRELGKIARGPTAQALIRALATEPGRPRYPLRWKSARQRRYVMAMLRRAGNIPYRRTHRLAQGWRVVLDSIQEGYGVFRVENNDRAVQFVQGDYAQPYHLDTGWPQAAPMIRAYDERFTSEVIDAWWRVCG